MDAEQAVCGSDDSLDWLFFFFVKHRKMQNMADTGVQHWNKGT